jgi:hypothetical protein
MSFWLIKRASPNEPGSNSREPLTDRSKAEQIAKKGGLG